MSSVANPFDRYKKTINNEEWKNSPYWEWNLENNSSFALDAENENKFYEAITNGKAYTLLPKEVVGDHTDMFEGSRSYEGIRECGCSILARTKKNTYREVYETKVIQKLLAVTDDVIRITAVGTGHLFGEFVLLTKLINELANNKISKNIEFNCIDLLYGALSPNEYKIQEKELAEEILPDAEEYTPSAVQKFIELTEKIIKIAKNNIKVTLRLFSEYSVAYHHKIENNYNCNLFIGADLKSAKIEVTGKEIPVHQYLRAGLDCAGYFLSNDDTSVFTEDYQKNGKGYRTRL